jgi:hypothetical protein
MLLTGDRKRDRDRPGPPLLLQFRNFRDLNQKFHSTAEEAKDAAAPENNVVEN